MKRLALDSSTDRLSLAFFEGDQLLLEHQANYSKQHGQTLVALVQNLLNELSWTSDQIENITIGHGPGSYTGLRIGVSFAKVWAATLACKVEAVSSLALMASRIPLELPESLLVPLMDARRLTAYTGAYYWQEGRLVNCIEDCHTDWTTWVKEDLIPCSQTLGLKQVVFIGEDPSDFIEAIQPDLFRAGLRYYILTGEAAKPRVANCLSLPLTSVTDVDVLEPFYAHQSLAEQEWAQNNMASEKQMDENYVEQTNETNLQ